MKHSKLWLVLATTSTIMSPYVKGHGYISAVEKGVVEGRATLCKFSAKTGEKNIGCGPVQWEPQSVEGPDGFPEAGPPDGQIASAGLASFSNLNEQTSNRWVKRPIRSGMQNFEWTYTANHVTRNWRYYITQPNWNPNQVLTRASFDLTPFCVVDGNMRKPPKRTTHACDVPDRNGYHVILAVWDVGDTAAAFYNVIDVQFNGDTPDQGTPKWSQVGTITPTMDLKKGDAVFIRVFDSSGERPDLQTRLSIESKQQGQSNQWAQALAKKVHEADNSIQAGQLDGKGSILPVFGVNTIWVAKDSDIKRVEIGYDVKTSPAPADVKVTGLNSEYTIGDTPVELLLNVKSTDNADIIINVYNHAQESLASNKLSISKDKAQDIKLALSKSEPGHHMLVTRVQDKDGKLINQTTQDFMLVWKTTAPAPSDKYDFLFPENLKEYKAQTKVMAKDGHIYQCKPFPNDGFCKQWSKHTTQYEPGVGDSWSMAWNKLN
ncbi:N-acetylglucosamine-binding protein GbpA [Vibrio caribbeanicus]|uniref:N-acetylglucosamine-binding protein A n=1 Tax=Vibrio caribbeanicus ATCC BAA-2122 TaxID=796620 RepID=E3BJY5_9VIBR|nr:N-acetylglucosamine-binding protein GbpA [Vibrio caribbeanicus]EFP96613.1 N-acetylglucosamine-binding protein A [Vibrio caribbeanicus ATCC BAA-2122]